MFRTNPLFLFRGDDRGCCKNTMKYNKKGCRLRGSWRVIVNPVYKRYNAYSVGGYWQHRVFDQGVKNMGYCVLQRYTEVVFCSCFCLTYKGPEWNITAHMRVGVDILSVSDLFFYLVFFSFFWSTKNKVNTFCPFENDLLYYVGDDLLRL